MRTSLIKLTSVKYLQEPCNIRKIIGSYLVQNSSKNLCQKAADQTKFFR